jgi:hypothetical protein
MAHLTGPIAYPQQTTVTVSLTSTSLAKIALGTRARDASGNEYMYVDFDSAKLKGEIVAISSAFLASDTGTSTVGVPIGVVCGAVDSSDLAGWVQIYGICDYFMCGSGTSVGPVQCGATSDGLSIPITLAGGTNVAIGGFYISVAPTTATSVGGANTSAMGIATAQLNYPFITGQYVGVTSVA